MKLFTLKNWVVMTIAVVTGIGFYLFRLYYENGEIRNIEWISAIISVVFALCICATVSWWGNKPEK